MKSVEKINDCIGVTEDYCRWKQYTHPHFWFQMAQNLYDAANALHRAFWPEKRIYHDLETAKSDFDKGPAYMLLAGLAVEVYLKGILIKRNPHLVKQQKLSKELTGRGHNLCHLYQKAGLSKIKVAGHEELLERLTIYVEDFGKYPVTKNANKMANNWLKIRFSSQTDFDRVNRLWDFLTKFASKLDNQNDDLSKGDINEKE